MMCIWRRPADFALGATRPHRRERAWRPSPTKGSLKVRLVSTVLSSLCLLATGCVDPSAAATSDERPATGKADSDTASCEALARDHEDLEAFVPAEHFESFGDCVQVEDLFTVEKVLDETYHLQFATQLEMNQAFVRIEAHYEAASDDFRGQVFELEEFQAWYTEEYGEWDFDTAYEGFNFPSTVLNAFESGAFENQTEMEKIIWRFFSGNDPGFYFIVTNRETLSDTMSHEIAHALFFGSEGYRREAEEALNSLDDASYDALHDVIVDEEIYGYHPEVAVDEMQAFLSSNWEELFCDPEVSALAGELDTYSDVILSIQQSYADHYDGPETASAEQVPLTERGCGVE